MTAPEWIIAVAAATWRRVAEKTAQTNALLLEMTEKVGGSDD